MKNLSLCNKSVRVNDEGLVSLTDMWRASGSKNRNRPCYFLKNGSTQRLIKEVKGKVRGNRGGSNPETWASKQIADRYKDWVKDIDTSRCLTEIKEKAALDAIEQVSGIEILRQYRIGKYLVDGYCKNTNTVFEIDESYHYVSGRLKPKCFSRQKIIEKKIGCRFVRIKI